jgi:hypothetical protein
MSSARNRPLPLANPAGSGTVRAEAQRTDEGLRSGVDEGTPPAEIANQVIAAIRADKLYILPHPQWTKSIRARLEGILEELNSTAPPA